MKSEHTHNPTTLLMKEDGDVDFLASLVNLVKKDDNPFTNTPGTDDTEFLGTESYRKRETVHHRLLDDQGFPEEVLPEQNRYFPVAETELDDEGNIINRKPPWVVNEAGQDLGTSHVDEAFNPPKGKDATPYYDKPENLQKFIELTGQRKKGLIIEGSDAALDAFLSKDHTQYVMRDDQREAPLLRTMSKRKDVTNEKDITKILPLLTMLMGQRANKDKVKTKSLKKSDDCGCD